MAGKSGTTRGESAGVADTAVYEARGDGRRQIRTGIWLLFRPSVGERPNGGNLPLALRM
ncbi:hypothetical protein C7S17_1751 [Burkholderia thailandensis]|nr:hypothetical protein [Burkholderia thailandensis]